MHIVIDIPKDYYRKCVDKVKNGESEDYLTDWIAKGILLPKGHGDLIDVNKKITVPVYDEQYEEWGEKTLTVREALNRWSDEGVSVEDVVILADKE